MKQTRNTLQKEVTYNSLKSFMGHPTADEVYGKVHEDFPHISKATVYRNLSVLEEKGMIRRIPKIGNGSDRYDMNMQPHFHAKCTKCGKVFDVDLPVDDSIVSKVNVMGDEKFKLSSYQLVFEGICTNCGAKEI